MTEQQLLREFLFYLRKRNAEQKSEIFIGEQDKDPEFVIVPFKRPHQK